jgi:cold shock CspA family protein
MQGTVATFDPDTRSGTLLLDDGSELPLGPEAFERSGLRLLRPGQRLVIESGPEHEVHRVGIPGIR